VKINSVKTVIIITIFAFLCAFRYNKVAAVLLAFAKVLFRKARRKKNFPFARRFFR